MQNKVLTTPVDNLIDIIKENSPITITQLQKKIKVPMSIVERWLVILEEYHIIKTTYKGLEGFVEFIKKKELKHEVELDEIKNVFIEKCKAKGLAFDKIKLIWPKFVQEYKEEIKKEFQKNAKKKGYNEVKISKAWMKFENDFKRI